MNRIIARNFTASSLRYAKFYDVTVPLKEAQTPISYNPSVCSIKVHRIPRSATPPKCPHGRYAYKELSEHKEGLRKIRESSVYYHQLQQETALVEIRGPLGASYVPIPEWLDLSVSSVPNPSIDVCKIDFWHGMGAKGGADESVDDERVVYDVASIADELKDADTKNGIVTEGDKYLHVECVDAEHPLQKRHWPFYKRRISTSVTGVCEGYVVPLKLVGVGYRASVEKMELRGGLKTSSKSDVELFEKFMFDQTHNVRKNIYRDYMSKQFKDSCYAQIISLRRLLSPEVNLNFKTFERVSEQDGEMPMPQFPNKLVLKLGFSHNVEMVIPPFIDVQIPNPNRIVLKGPHLRYLTEFASQIRKWRSPEPYKGKGIFVGDETITLKSRKVK